MVKQRIEKSRIAALLVHFSGIAVLSGFMQADVFRAFAQPFGVRAVCQPIFLRYGSTHAFFLPF